MNLMIRASIILFVAGFLSSFLLMKSSLHVTVRDEVGNIVQGATVQLFATEQDYNKEQNVAAEGTTDEKGIVKFKELKPIKYYIIVRKDDKDNSGGGEQTKLEDKKVNKVTIIIQ